MEERVTIAHVADAAGVSVPTVSKVVNGRADVAPETRARVERVLQQQGYRRRRAPARDASAELLDVVFNELESPWAMEIVKGVEEVAREHGLGVVLSAQEGPGALGRSWVDAVAARRSAGLILVVSELTDDQVARLRAREASPSWWSTRRASRRRTSRRWAPPTGTAGSRPRATCSSSGTAASA